MGVAYGINPTWAAQTDAGRTHIATKGIVQSGLVLNLDAGVSSSYDKYENLISHSASTSGIVLGVIGSGGSLPTGWVIDQGQPGTTLEVVGYGIEEGLNYIDLKFSGTTSTTNRWLVRPGNAVTLTSGVTYNSSVYAKTISGTPTEYRQFSVFGGFSGASLSGINSTLTRYSGSSAAGSTGTYYPRLDIGYNSIGTVMNFTIRVAGFQAEVGSLVTDYYPTTGTIKNRGTTWTDLSGNGNNGTLTGGPTYSSSNGGSIVFDGSNDYVSGPTFSSVLNYQTSGTIECFFKIISSPSADFVDIWGFANQSTTRVIWFESSTIVLDNLRFVWRLSSGSLGAIDTNIAPSTNRNINQVVCSYEVISTDITFRVYINGTFYNSSTVSGSLTNSPSLPLSIGGNLGIQSFNCNIYNFKIYNRALTAQEISQNFNAMRGRFGI